MSKNCGVDAVDALGWSSSLVVVATIAKQVHRQWTAGRSEGVSAWLFAGQLAASVGFTTYSVFLGDPVFVVTNSLLLVAAIAGLAILLRQRHGARRDRLSRPVRPSRTARQRLASRQGAWRRGASPSGPRAPRSSPAAIRRLPR